MGNFCHSEHHCPNRDSEIQHLKVLVVGAHKVGKTTFINQLVFGRFQGNCSQTIGTLLVLIIAHQFYYYTTNGVHIQIIDTPGIEMYQKCIPQTLIDAAQIVLFISDGKASSLQSLWEWDQKLSTQTKILIHNGPMTKEFQDNLSELGIDFQATYNLQNYTYEFLRRQLTGIGSRSTKIDSMIIKKSVYHPNTVEYI